MKYKAMFPGYNSLKESKKKKNIWKALSKINK